MCWNNPFRASKTTSFSSSLTTVGPKLRKSENPFYMCPLFFTLFPLLISKIGLLAHDSFGIYIKIKLLVHNKFIHAYIKCFGDSFFLFCSCYLLNWFVAKWSILLCELKMLFIQRADKENLSLVSTTRCSFKRRKPCTYKRRSLFWIHIGRRHPEQRYGDHIWSLWNKGWLISFSL